MGEERKRDDKSSAPGDVYKRQRDFHDSRGPLLSITPPGIDVQTAETQTILSSQAATIAITPTSRRTKKFVLPSGPPML